MEAIEITFGKAVRARREALGLSQEKFAVVAGIHRTYVSQVERAKVQVSIAVAEKLATALGVPLSQLWLQIERSRKQPKK